MAHNVDRGRTEEANRILIFIMPSWDAGTRAQSASQAHTVQREFA
jgi:hypothetical protein